MTITSLRRSAAVLGIGISDWSADYRASLRDRPVRPRVSHGDVRAQLPTSPPEQPEAMEQVFATGTMSPTMRTIS